LRYAASAALYSGLRLAGIVRAALTAYMIMQARTR